MTGKIRSMAMMATSSRRLLLQTTTICNTKLPFSLTSHLCRSLSTKILTPALTFLTNGSTKELKAKPDLSNYASEGRPLTILLCWLMSKDKAVQKYADFYLDQGFDVLTVRISPLQLLLPSKAEPIVRNEILPTLMTSDHDKKLIHGFSVGGYVFGRMLKYIQDDPVNGQELLRSFKAQIWDSVVDVNGTSIGVSKSVFMNSPRLQKGLQTYIDFHMKVLHNIATKYYLSSHEYFVYQPLRAPSLFLCSAIDPISTVQDIRACQKQWLQRGITCDNKIWTNTGHVGHMKAYPEEYKAVLRNFIQKNGMEPSGGRIVSKRTLATDDTPLHEGSFSYLI